MKEFLHSFRKYEMLQEDSRGSIVNNLGIAPRLADLFHEESPKHSYTLAMIFDRVMKSYVGNMPDWRAFSRAPKDWIYAYFDGDEDEQINFEAPYGIGALLLRAIEYRPQLAKKVRKMEIDDIILLLDSIQDELSARREGSREKMLSFPDGYYWTDLCTNDSKYEKKHMQHCGADGGGSLVSLRDANHRPHVTMTYQREKNAIVQIKGKQNSAPVEKYWPHVAAFFKKTGAQLLDYGETMELFPEFFAALAVGGKTKKRVRADGRTEYYLHGKLHRTNGAAVLHTNGTKEYYRYGKRHRVGGPAIISPTMRLRAWYVNGRLHRDGGPARIVYRPNGKDPSQMKYYQHDRLHRDGAPAVIDNYHAKEAYYQHGVAHREDGPAVLMWRRKKNGLTPWQFYYLHGKEYSLEDWERAKSAREHIEKFRTFISEKEGKLAEMAYDAIGSLLFEDSRSSIMGTLGLSADVAAAAIAATEALSLNEDAAFLILKVYYLHLLEWQFDEDEEGYDIVVADTNRKLAGKMARKEIEVDAKRSLPDVLIRGKEHNVLESDIIQFWSTGGRGRSQWPPFILYYLRKGDRTINKILRSVRGWHDLDPQLKEFERKIQMGRIKEDLIMEFPDGYFWVKVKECDHGKEADHMQHCGSSDYTMVSLRDPNHKPHVTMDWDEENGTIWQAKGKQNALPIEKYYPYIFKFVDDMGVRKFEERGAAAGGGAIVDDTLYDAVHANTNMPKPPFKDADPMKIPPIETIKKMGRVRSATLLDDEATVRVMAYFPSGVRREVGQPTSLDLQRELRVAGNDLKKKLRRMGPWDFGEFEIRVTYVGIKGGGVYNRDRIGALIDVTAEEKKADEEKKASMHDAWSEHPEFFGGGEE